MSSLVKSIQASCGFEEYSFDKKPRGGGTPYPELFISVSNMFIIQMDRKCYKCCRCVVILIKWYVRQWEMMQRSWDGGNWLRQAKNSDFNCFKWRKVSPPPTKKNCNVQWMMSLVWTIHLKLNGNMLPWCCFRVLFTLLSICNIPERRLAKLLFW